MANRNNNALKPKISLEFSKRLSRLSPKQRVRAIVMLDIKSNDAESNKVPHWSNRQAIIKNFRQSINEALPEIDSILSRFNGKRLENNFNALGYVSVETTVLGVDALADSDYVKAIIEDQNISPLAK